MAQAIGAGLLAGWLLGNVIGAAIHAGNEAQPVYTFGNPAAIVESWNRQSGK